MKDSEVEAVARAICAEKCAVYGEPPCHQVVPDEWPNPNCDEPGCHTYARVAIAALDQARKP